MFPHPPRPGKQRIFGKFVPFRHIFCYAKRARPNHHPLPMRISPLSTLCLGLVLAASCSKKDEAAGPAQMPPAPVSFITTARSTVTQTTELPGRITAVRTAEIRARVPGILLRQCYTEGRDVKAGEVLFRIDPAPLEAARDTAAAAVARAEAAAAQSDAQVRRARSLITTRAISPQDLDQAEAAWRSARADVQAAQASLQTANLNLGYATVTSPIDGRIGRALVTEGALVGQGSPTLLAVVQQLDPVHCDFSRTSAELTALRQSGGERGNDKARLLLESGTEYPQPGRILSTESAVDAATGMVAIRAEFPNPAHLLLPGQFVRVRVTQQVRENIITVPQRAVTLGKGGSAMVLVIDSTNHVQPRPVTTAVAWQDQWIVTSGLEAGERVVVEGLLKARPGSPVVPEPFTATPAAR